MISPSRCYWEACGSPVIEDCTDIEPGGLCWVCGYPTGSRGVLVGKWSGAHSVTGAKIRAPGGSHVCEPCVHTCLWSAPPGRAKKPGEAKGPNPPMYSHLWQGGAQPKYTNASKGEKPLLRSLLREPKTGPWWGVIADSGKKHLIPWAPVNAPAGTRGVVMFDERDVTLGDLSLIDAMTELLSKGVTKTALGAGQYYPRDWLTHRHAIRAFEESWGSLRGGSFYELCLWLSQRPEETTEDGRDTDGESRDDGSTEEAEDRERRPAEPHTRGAGRDRDGAAPAAAPRAASAVPRGRGKRAEAVGGDVNADEGRVLAEQAPRELVAEPAQRPRHHRPDNGQLRLF